MKFLATLSLILVLMGLAQGQSDISATSRRQKRGNSIRAGGLRFGGDFRRGKTQGTEHISGCGSECGCSVRKIALGGGEKLEESA
ncbi:hypothetical protein M5D96_003764 [Drosophila gunungcola]|uniref:Uncharacterized protein n=1 Tax=Drosophila gunungcola TaxID=103775 RepID=A0A9P9YSV0_9MUSC|nr:hypothetical protein M5D96_003764 [Drosophila gunungcola]